MDNKTGGTAFPSGAASVGPDGYMRCCESATPGMTLLDWFAGQALAGLCGSPDFNFLPWDKMADSAYTAADAMLAEKARREAAK